MTDRPPLLHTHVILVKDYEQKNFYFNKLRKGLLESGRAFEENGFILFIGDDVYRFLTPDEPHKLLGLTISDWWEEGTVYEHPRLNDMRSQLDARTR